MNRTILIVICDFLLVSLLAFSTVDINKVAEEGVERQVRTEIITNQAPPEAGKDLAAVMRVALDDERKSRDLLMSELDRARQAIADRERQVASARQEIQSKDDQSRRMAEAQSSLQSQFTTAQANIQQLTQKLNASATEALVSKEKLAALEAEILKRAQEAAAMQAQMSALAKSNQTVLAERQELAGKLQVAEVEKRHAAEQAAKMTEQVRIEREEKTKLAESVKTLASQSGELAREVRETRPVPPNVIFNEFAANRVAARIAASKPGLIDMNRRRDTETVLVSNGTNSFALCHVTDTPLVFSTPATDWESLTGALVRGPVQVPVRSLSFHLEDPRLVFMPITQQEAKQLGGRTYTLAKDPYKFEDVVLVGTGDAYYGECRFQVDLTAPGYLRLDNSFIRGLFGKFNPSRGDLVFSKGGELVGVMMNGTYCLVVRGFETGASLQFGKDIRRQQPGGLLSMLHGRVLGMPPKLQ